MSARPLALLAAAAGLGALALGLPPGGPPLPADGPAAAPTPVLRMIGLAAPTTAPHVPIDKPALDEATLNHWMNQRQYAEALLALQGASLDAATKAGLLDLLLSRWAASAPEQAARWALHTPGQSALLAPLHDRWLQLDARSATVFASTLPAGEQRQSLLEEGLQRWAAQDGPGARDWLRSYAPRPDLDEAIARHASADELARHAPLEAMDLVARIAAPERRLQAWQALARSLHDVDPDQAAVLLARAPGLWPAERAKLLEELR